MDVTITEADDKSTTEMEDLQTALVRAYGSELPDTVSGITGVGGTYTLHFEGVNVGSAFGECLAANGWVIIGVHTHYSDGDDIDQLSVKRIEDCGGFSGDSTIMYDEGDEDKIDFNEVEE